MHTYVPLRQRPTGNVWAGAIHYSDGTGITSAWRRGLSEEIDNDLAGALEREALMNHRLLLNRTGRQFVQVAGTRWGELSLPTAKETSTTPAAGLQLVLFASFEFGYLALEAIKAYALHFSKCIQIVALVTDDPVNPTARIGLKKRVGSTLIGKSSLCSRPRLPSPH